MVAGAFLHINALSLASRGWRELARRALPLLWKGMPCPPMPQVWSRADRQLGQ